MSLNIQYMRGLIKQREIFIISWVREAQGLVYFISKIDDLAKSHLHFRERHFLHPITWQLVSIQFRYTNLWEKDKYGVVKVCSHLLFKGWWNSKVGMWKQASINLGNTCICTNHIYSRHGLGLVTPTFIKSLFLELRFRKYMENAVKDLGKTGVVQYISFWHVWALA